MNQYIILTKLGQGAFSVVYKVKRKEDGKEYAMKKIRIMNLNQKELSNCLNEVRILASIQHPHILSYKDSFYDELSNTFCIVTQLLEGGDVFQMIQKYKQNKKGISENIVWKVAFQTLQALSRLHSLNILHRDIKSANIFFSKNYNSVILADMNVSIVTANGMAKTQTGTPYYASPEVWMQKPYSSKCDVWSLGCVLYEMATLRPPFMGIDLKMLKKTIIGGVYKRLSTSYSSQLDKFIQLCLTVDPKQRSSVNELLQSQFFKNKSMTDVEKDDSINVSSRSRASHVLLEKILPPRKRNFKNIKEQLPKHRFHTQAVQTVTVNKSFCESKNKENLLNSQNNIKKNELLPLINRSKSVFNNQKKITLTQRLEQSHLPKDEIPPLPKKPLRC